MHPRRVLKDEKTLTKAKQNWFQEEAHTHSYGRICKKVLPGEKRQRRAPRDYNVA